MTERLIDGYDGVLADLDGVVYAGPHAIPGATAASSSPGRARASRT